MKHITIDGVEYAPVQHLTDDHVLIRAASSGVHVGRLVRRDGDEVELADARRLWYWAGAATVSDLATTGTSKPNDCKFPASVPSITVLGVIEVIPMTPEAVESIASVPVWKS